MARRNKSETRLDTQRPLLVYLQGILASLRPTERLIAECVLADPEKVLASSIAEIKHSSGASVGSIVAFCRRLGLKGFADFKLPLARDLAQSGLPAGDAQQQGIDLCEGLSSPCAKLGGDPSRSTLRPRRACCPNHEKARKIELVLHRLFLSVAYTACCKFQLIGLPAATQFDSHIQLIAATQLKAGDVALVSPVRAPPARPVQCLEVATVEGPRTTNGMPGPMP